MKRELLRDDFLMNLGKDIHDEKKVLLYYVAKHIARQSQFD